VSTPPSLGGDISIASSARWIGLSRALQLAVQIGGLLVLARLLPPADFGLLAMAGAITTFAGVVRDMGTGSAVIQSRALDDNVLSAIFWLNVVVGTALAVLAALLAPAFSQVFKEPRIVTVLICLALAFPIASSGITHQALLERDSHFKRLALISGVSSVFGLVAAIALAYQGAGVFALVAQTLTSSTLSTLLLWASQRWRPSMRIRLAELRPLMAYSGNVFSFNILNYFHRNADTMIVGRFLGSVDLGIYNLAYRTVLFPLQNMTFVLTRAAFPAYSRSQHDLPAMAKHYVGSLRMIVLVTAPAMAFLWALREPLVDVVLGHQWAGVTGVMAWLAPVGFVQSMVSTSGTVLLATGRARTLRNLGLIGVPMFVCSFVLGVPWGPDGVAAAYCIANLVWMLPVMHVTLKPLGVGLPSLFLGLLAPTATAAVTAAGLAALHSRGALAGNGSAIELLTLSALGCGAYGVSAWLLFPDLIREAVAAITARSAHQAPQSQARPPP